MKYENYHNIKQVNSKWITCIPYDWNLVRIKVLGKTLNGGTPKTDNPAFWENGSIPWLPSGKVQNNFLNLIDADIFITEDAVNNSATKLIKPNSVLVALTGATCGNIGFLNFESTANQSVVAIEPNTLINNKYLYYSLLAQREQIIFLKSGGAQGGITSDDVRNLIVTLPSNVKEQTAIVNFIEPVLEKIDGLIEKQKKLIDLLKEKRQSVISNAVTKGLYSSVKMSNSGVEWLGEIPEHWEITKIKYIATASNGLTYSPDDLVDQEEGVLVLRSSNIQQGDISLDDNVYVKMAIPEKAVVRSGDILICSRNGSRDLIGKNALIPDSLDGVAYGAFMMLLRSDISEYIYWILNSYIFKFQSSLFLTSTINQLTVSDLYGFEVPIPPKSEQFEIIKYLQESTKQINLLIENAKKSVLLLQERRSALISAAVTGQIDVRNYQIKEDA